MPKKCRSKYSRARVHRSLHLIDIENLLGMPPVLATVDDFIEAAACYLERVQAGPEDQYIVACDVTNAFEARAAFPGARLVFGRGPDGADRALIDAVDVDHVATRFDRVYLGSGDCAFTWLCYELEDKGLDVTVVSLSRGLSRRLISPGRDVLYVQSIGASRHLEGLGTAS